VVTVESYLSVFVSRMSTNSLNLKTKTNSLDPILLKTKMNLRKSIEILLS
jgi:hypothetical protein